MAPYATMIAKAATTVCQNCAPTVTLPFRPSMITTLTATATTRVPTVATTLTTASDTHLATRMRGRRGSPRYVDVTVP